MQLCEEQRFEFRACSIARTGRADKATHESVAHFIVYLDELVQAHRERILRREAIPAAGV